MPRKTAAAVAMGISADTTASSEIAHDSTDDDDDVTTMNIAAGPDAMTPLKDIPNTTLKSESLLTLPQPSTGCALLARNASPYTNVNSVHTYFKWYGTLHGVYLVAIGHVSHHLLIVFRLVTLAL